MVVLAQGQGSGVLIGPRMVITAQHVVEGDDVIVKVMHRWGTSPVACQVVWADRKLDAAVLLAEDDVISAERAAPLGTVRVGEVATQSPLPHCQIVGFPQVQRYGERGEDLEYDQFRASILPMAGRLRDVLVCELDQPAVAERGDRTSPLRGLSGAPVFAGAVLLGVVTQVPRDRRHQRVEAVAVDSVLKAAAAILSWELPVEEVTEVHPRDERFEARYAADLTSQYRKTEIFGIDELGRSEARWDLDTAYLSLEADGPHGVTRQRIDTLLTDRPRVLLRGEAGAGKTTLVWWLAAHAANGTLGEDLAALNGLVPFVVPLRQVHAHGGRIPAVSELLVAGRVITEGPPEGWARRVLEAGRGLLLVDGLDEVPEREREEARRWLTALLDRYARTRCLATVRPNAVERDWLASDDFDELTLLPMSDDDIRAFVRAWHDAARLECGHLYDARRGRDERQLLTTLEQNLTRQLDHYAALRDLARTPLLCAVICALHRRRGGLLPTTRWSLYRAALAMLLGGRDAGRGVRNTDHVALDSDEQHALLQRIAIWLVRTGQQQMTGEQAVQQLGLALRDMPQILAHTTPEEILRFLLDRSGLLQERTDDAIQFIHRTFQDFLAAKEFHESGYVLELLEHAESEAWQDLIVLGVGHATRRDAHHLVEKLVEFGDAAEGRAKRWYLHMLAARCATSLLLLDATLMGTVRERVRALLPPTSSVESGEVVRLGEWIVELLPRPDQLDVTGAVATAGTLTFMYGPRARQALKRFTEFPSQVVRDQLVDGWNLQPPDVYAQEVLAGIDLDHLRVDTQAKLVQLHHFGSLTRLDVSGSYSAEELDAHLPIRGVDELQFEDNHRIEDLGFLRKRSDLRRLVMSRSSSLRDLSALQDLDLTTLHLHVGDIAGDQLGFLRGMRGLRTLVLTGVPLADGWAGLKPHSGVSSLRVHSDDTAWLDGLHGWTGLEELDADSRGQEILGILSAVSRGPRIHKLTLWINSFRHLAPSGQLPQVSHLQLYGVRDYTNVAQLRRVFPGLKRLRLRLTPPTDVTDPINLTSLLDLPDLRIELSVGGPQVLRVLGSEEFADRLSCQLPHSGT